MFALQKINRGRATSAVRSSTTRGLSVAAAGALLAGTVLVGAPGVSAQAEPASSAADQNVVAIERTLTITPSSPSKTWTVPATIDGSIDVSVTGAPGHGLQGGGAAAALDFSTVRPAGEPWEFVFGARDSQTFAPLAGGTGAGLPAATVGIEAIWQWPWKAVRQSGGNGGDATAIVVGAAPNTESACSAGGSVLAVAGGGGGGSGESRIYSFTSFVRNAAYRGGESGKNATQWQRGAPLSGDELCEASGANSRGGSPQGEELERHAGGGGGGGGAVAGDGGASDRMTMSFVNDHFVSAAGGNGGVSYLSPSVCGTCSDHAIRPSTAGPSVTLRWHERHSPVITADSSTNPLVVRVVSAQTGQPLPGTITVGRDDRNDVFTSAPGVGRWEMDALAHVRDINVIPGDQDPGRYGFRNVTLRYNPSQSQIDSASIVHPLASVEATTAVTTRVRREADGRFLLIARWDALLGTSALTVGDQVIEVRANPPRTFDDTVAVLPLRSAAGLPVNSRCLAVRMDAPDDTRITFAFASNDAFQQSSSSTYVDSATPRGDIGMDCGTPVDLHIDAPPLPSDAPADEGEWPTNPNFHWNGAEILAFERPPSGYQPGKIVLQRVYWVGDGEENYYVAHYYYDHTYAGYATYDHSGWGLALPKLTPGEHTVQVVLAPGDVQPGSQVPDGLVGPTQTLTVPADATTTTLEVAADTSSQRMSGGEGVQDAREVPLSEPLHLRARVEGVAVSEVPGGVVGFYDDDVLLGYAPVVGGTAELGDIRLDAIANRVHAEYLGLGGIASSSRSDSEAVGYDVVPTEVEIQGAPETAVADAAGEIVFTARAAEGGLAPSGSLSLWSTTDHELFTFSDADAVPGEDGVSLQWHLPLADLSADIHTLEARFTGDPGFGDSRSEPVTTAVSKRATTLTAEILDRKPEGIEVGVAAAIDETGKTDAYRGQRPSGDIRVYVGDQSVADAVLLDGRGTVRVKASSVERARGALRIVFTPASYDTGSAEITLHTGGGELASTGADRNPTLSAATGGLLLVIGAGALLAARRRRQSAIAAAPTPWRK